MSAVSPSLPPQNWPGTLPFWALREAKAGSPPDPPGWRAFAEVRQDRWPAGRAAAGTAALPPADSNPGRGPVKPHTLLTRT